MEISDNRHVAEKLFTITVDARNTISEEALVIQQAWVNICS
jgi:hypothetical protein